MALFHTVLILALLTFGCAPHTEAEEADETPETDAVEAVRTSGPQPDVARAVDNAASAEHHTDRSAGTPTIDPVAMRPAMRAITIPAGTTLNLQLAAAISPRVSATSGSVRAMLQEPIKIDGETVIPAGASLSGYVTQEDSAAGADSARTAIRIDTLRIGKTRYRSAGAAVIVREEGEEATLTPGTVVVAQLTQPVTIRVH